METTTNTARVALNNPLNGNNETVETRADAHAIAHAILDFALREYLPPSRIEVSITYSPEGASPAPSSARRIPPATVAAA